MNCQVVEDTLSVMKKCTEEITLRKSMVSNAFAFRLKNEKKNLQRIFLWKAINQKQLRFIVALRQTTFENEK